MRRGLPLFRGDTNGPMVGASWTKGSLAKSTASSGGATPTDYKPKSNNFFILLSILEFRIYYLRNIIE